VTDPFATETVTEKPFRHFSETGFSEAATYSSSKLICLRSLAFFCHGTAAVAHNTTSSGCQGKQSWCRRRQTLSTSHPATVHLGVGSFTLHCQTLTECTALTWQCQDCKVKAELCHCFDGPLAKWMLEMRLCFAGWSRSAGQRDVENGRCYCICQLGGLLRRLTSLVAIYWPKYADQKKSRHKERQQGDTQVHPTYTTPAIVPTV